LSSSASDLVREDPFVLDSQGEDQLLANAPWKRFAVLGDSVAEGVGDKSSGYGDDPWVPRVVRALARQRPELEHVNLGRRYLRTSQIRDSQLLAALDFKPDLAAIVCGGNDLLAEDFDPDGVERNLDAIVEALGSVGAEVLTFTMFDITTAFEELRTGPLRPRLRELHRRVRRVSSRRGALLTELDRHPAGADRGIYSEDLQHCNTRGHAIAASLTIRRLGLRLGNASAGEHERARLRSG
jgi:hypothetical protein